MLESAKKVLAARIEQMTEEALLALLEETFPYVGHTVALDFSFIYSCIYIYIYIYLYLYIFGSCDGLPAG